MQNSTPGPNEMYCSSCGAVVKIWASICLKCGVKVSGQRNAPPIAAPPPAETPYPTSPTPSQVRATKDLPILHTVVLATIGSVLAIPGVFQAELLGGILGPWIWAPIIEEIFKPAGVYLLLLQWPRALKNQIYTALLTALAGISFGLVESTIYVTVYIPDPTTQEVVLRFTLPVFMHALASFIFGLGINKRLMVPLTGGGSIHVSNWGFFVAAIAIHSIYNITVTIIEVIGAV